MSTKPHSSDAAAHFEAFLTAGVADLCRLAELRTGMGVCPGIKSPRRASTVARIPASPAAAQLSLYLLLVSRGLQAKHKTIYPHRKRLQDLLQRVYRRAVKSWDDGDLKDVQGLQPGVSTLAKFARRNIPGFENTTHGLDAFGVHDVRFSLGILTEKLAMTFAREIAKNPTKAPVELVGASLVASATSPGVIKKFGDGHTVRGLMQLGMRAGLMGTRLSKPGTKAAGLDELRKFLKRADRVLDS